jgi:hypothetical protein
MSRLFSHPYSPYCLEGVFSETHIRLDETLCNRTGGKRRFASVARSGTTTTSSGAA